MSRHRAPKRRPAYARFVALAGSTGVTAAAVLAGLSTTGASSDTTRPAVAAATPLLDPEGAVVATDATSPRPPGAVPSPVRGPADTSNVSRSSNRRQRGDRHPLPAESGEGRRVVFSESEQRVWLVEEDGTVARTYLVSGSAEDNLEPGTYEVYSRSERAWGIDNSGTMEWFVRFTRGDNAAIGFHTIPELDGVPLQSVDELGTPLSHGCIRQREADAVALWEFAPLGTTVVVV